MKIKSGWKQQKVRGIASSRSPEMVARILDRHRAAKISPMHTVQALPSQAAPRKWLDEVQSIFNAVDMDKKV